MNWRKSNSFTGAFGHKPDCWLDFLVCPRRHLAVLPSQVRPNLFAGDQTGATSVPRPDVMMSTEACAGSPFSAAIPTCRSPGRPGSLASNAMRVLSGDHVGRHVSPGPFVIWTGSLLARAAGAGMTYK